MLKINEWPRVSGKSTEIENIMTENQDVILITPNRQMAHFYPKDIKEKTLSVNDNFFLEDIQILSHKGHKFLFDEGLSLNSTVLARLYYEFGQLDIDIEVYATDKAMVYNRRWK